MAKLDIEKKFLETIHHYKLINKDEKILVMVSGGRDSVALLHLLYDNISKNLHIFHLNHLLREDSYEDEDFVRNIAGKMKLPLTILQFDVKSLSEERKLSIQDAARKVRYRLSTETAKNISASKIATGHQLNDNVETFLYRLIKGAGLSGLRSIPIKRKNIIRPLLNISRDDITSYLKSNKIGYIEDPSNIKLVYTRNKIRHGLIPKIKEINPSFDETIQSVIDIIGQDDDFIEDQAQKVIKKSVLSPEIVETDYEDFKILPNPLQRRFIRLAVSHIKGDLLGLEYKHITSIQEKSQYYNFSMDLPDNTVVFREADKLIFSSRSLIEKTVIKPKQLPVPGKAYFKELDLTIENKEYKPIPHLTSMEPVIDFDKIKPPLSVRQWADGDRFQPLGMQNKKKLQDFFTDRKIPSRLKSNIPIIADSEKIIWIAGLEIDDRVKITKKTTRGLKFRMINGRL